MILKIWQYFNVAKFRFIGSTFIFEIFSTCNDPHRLRKCPICRHKGVRLSNVIEIEYSNRLYIAEWINLILVYNNILITYLINILILVPSIIKNAEEGPIKYR